MSLVAQLRRVWVAAAIACVCAVPAAIEATTQDQVFQLQLLLEQRLSPLVRAYDPLAIVYAQISPRTTDAPLPATPFVFKDLVLQAPSGDLKVEKLDVIVYSQFPEMPNSVVKMIRDLTRAIGPPVTIRLRPLPKQMEAIERVEDPEEPPDPKIAILQSMADEGSRLTLWIAGMVGLLSTLLLILSGVLHRGMRHVSDTLRGGGGGVGGKVALMSGGGALETTPVEPIFSALPEDGVLAILSDCYWGQFDSYAAFIWKRLSVGRKVSLLVKWESLVDYASHLSTESSIDLHMEQEPYYLNPFPIWHLDNRVLGTLVERSPALLFRLPPLRRTAIELSPAKRVEVTRLSLAGKSAPLPDFTKLSASVPRKLRSSSRLQIRSVDEESEILKLPGLAPELMDSIPSLGWLLKLPGRRVDESLARFSPEELAEAWIGPKEVLERLGRHLPSGKLQAVRAHLKAGITPSRASPMFLAIHDLAISLLKAALATGAAEKKNGNGRSGGSQGEPGGGGPDSPGTGQPAPKKAA